MTFTANLGEQPESIDPQLSIVSWGAILAGGIAAASLALILIMLGMGLGLYSQSPLSYSALSTSAVGVSSIMWLTFTQLVASGFGGYLAGKLRVASIVTNTGKINFHNYVHGFLVWSVAVLTSALLLTTTIDSSINNGKSISEGVVNTTKADLDRPNNRETLDYFVDLLFRMPFNSASAPFNSEGIMPSGISEQAVARTTAEATRIFAYTLRLSELSTEDTRYVARLVAMRTGLMLQNAEKRVNDTYERMQAKILDSEKITKELADNARKAFTYVALWLFVSLLFGALVASVAASYAGRSAT